MSVHDIAKKIAPKLAIFAVVGAAAFTAYVLYARHTNRPWTRDAQVRADVVKIAPRVSGYIVKVDVKDNQFVRAGKLLFQIDRIPYQLALDKAQVELDQAREQVL